MATIDYKEKYMQALERARQFSEKPYLEDSAGIVEYIFPELKESEDEKIRKELLHFVQNERNCMDSSVKPENSPKLRFLIDAIAWLEKLGDKPQGKSAMEAAKEEKVDNQNCVEPAKTEQKNKWKPTDDQINELQRLVTSIPYFTGFRIVVGLLIDLKKLREE